MEPLVYDTVMNANRTGHLPCHERYAERRIMLKLHIPISVNCHTTKSKRSFRLHRALTRVYVRLGWDAPSLSRGVLRAVFVE